MSADGRPQKVVFRLALPEQLKQELGDLSLTQAQAVALDLTLRLWRGLAVVATPNPSAASLLSPLPTCDLCDCCG
jgi:hypothetical protein